MALGGIPDHILRICQNERILLPSIEPKIIPEDVCVAKELNPDEHPEVFWMEEIRKYKEKGDLPDNPAEAAKEKPEECLPESRQPETPLETPHSRNRSLDSGEILSYPQELVGVSPPSPHPRGWGEGLRRYPPPHDHREPVFFDEASLGEPVRSDEESAVREDQRHPSSSSSWVL
nr:uncharacterized protein LOC109162254 [Ipomoea trifida]